MTELSRGVARTLDIVEDATCAPGGTHPTTDATAMTTSLIEKWQGLAATLQQIRNTAGRNYWRPSDGRPLFVGSIR